MRLWNALLSTLVCPLPPCTIDNTYTRRAKNFDIPSDIGEALHSNINEITALVKVMRNIFYTAASVTPLLVLLPMSIPAEGIRRDYLLAVRMFAPFPMDSTHVLLSQACSFIRKSKAQGSPECRKLYMAHVI